MKTISKIILLLLLTSSCFAENILTKQIFIPMNEAGSKGLETLLVWPNLPGKHPLALISHGSPRDAKLRPKMSAISYLPIATELARRGFAVAIVMRRGYGYSGGKWAEGYNSCSAANYKMAAKESVKDLKASIKYLGTLPQFDTDHILAIGVSAGGFASIALSADSPQGLVAVINFAGVRGSQANNTLCHLDTLISTFEEFGKTSRVPMLWIYAKNDHFANPETAQKLLKAFESHGAKVTFIEAPAFGKEGHALFSSAGINQWLPMVDHFLREKKLITVKELLPKPEAAHLNAPSQLTRINLASFNTYLTAPPHKAFAIDAKGAFGYSTGNHTVDEAKQNALGFCRKFSKGECRIYAVDDKQLP